MTQDSNKTAHTSRRRLLTVLGTSTAALAGCNAVLPETGSDGSTPEESSAGGETDVAEASTGPTHWPAIENGELLSAFEDLDRWSAETGELSADPDEARTGSQAAVLESDGAQASMSIQFSEGVDMTGWDASLAVKPESADRIRVQFLELATDWSAPPEPDRVVDADADYPV